MTWLSSTLSSLAFLACSWTIYSYWCLFRNYKKARKFGFHVIVNPVSLLNPLWIIFNQTFRPLLEKLPFGLYYYFKYTNFEWTYHEKYGIHEKHGDAFCIVTPAWVQLYIGDAGAIEEVEGATWQRHRKLTTPPFNERNSALVWKESLRQSGQMLSFWLSQGDRGVRTTCADTLVLALHVLTRAGFGQEYSFNSGTKAIAPGHVLSYKDALCNLLDNFTVLIMFKHTILDKPYLPRYLRDVGLALREFKQYMTEMIDQERERMRLRDSKPDVESENLITSLIRASEEGKAANYSLTDDEIMGNLFIYNLAGHETTANTLAYVITLLSVHPEYRDWLYEELDVVLADAGPPDGWKYEELFPRLKRCLAAMYETLRLYGPVPELKRCVKDSSQTLSIGGKRHVIPPGTFVVMNHAANHTNPSIWGKDSLEWKPTRWIDNDGTNGDEISNGDVFKQPPVKGCYMPWFDSSPRICPGKKFSQVEFVAVLASLFKDHTVNARPEADESTAQAKQRVMNVVNDSGLRITLQMKHPETVALDWQKR
ncbi:uncharacterized protein KY384_007088 [Bacidia gigantensis]|uniref:uncharacterized protein n=1 Tax=Bacidia gigantensis TaxID=2732470 RepID=UPI001D041C50|nr:uncharacterized protein KY384_007088 [Bacidia gigantensis]KAG8528171.1 hypothetical protein KY384_007088 [Bacidia gigantensis]